MARKEAQTLLEMLEKSLPRTADIGQRRGNAVLAGRRRRAATVRVTRALSRALPSRAG